MSKPREKVKCPGRFSNLRDYIYGEVFPTLDLHEGEIVTYDHLKNALDLIQDSLYTLDRNPNPALDDSYFEPSDLRRKPETLDALSLVPLVDLDTYHLQEGLIQDYALHMGVSSSAANTFESLREHPPRFFTKHVSVLPKDISYNGISLAGYQIGANFGVGTTCGFPSTGQLRSDAPFILEIFEPFKKDWGLVGVVGFWAQGKDMLAYQIQSCREGHFPQGSKFGVMCLRTLEELASNLGFKRVLVPEAKSHPLFKEHPADINDPDFMREMNLFYNESAKTLGYVHEGHSFGKRLTNS